jgi:hypothetical protein
MKLNRILGFVGITAFLAFSACDPIEDREELANSFNPDAIDLEVVQATSGGNKLSIQMNTDGVTGYWDYIIDTKYTDRVDVVFPFTGTHEFTFHSTTPYMAEDGNPESREFVEKTVSVEITQLDEPLPEAYYALIGENLEGKTWVFDGGPAPDGGLWYFMSANDNPDGYMSPWWNAAGDCCPPPDAAGHMVFDLAGGANYTHYSGPNADPVQGNFAFNGDYTQLTIGGDAKLLGYFSHEGVVAGSEAGKYQIMELSADRLALYVPSNGYGTGWTFIFVPAE